MIAPAGSKLNELAAAIEADGAEFDADMAYLRGLSDAVFEHGSHESLVAIAQRDALQ